MLGVSINGFHRCSHVLLTALLITNIIIVSSTVSLGGASPTLDLEQEYPDQPLSPVPSLTIELSPEVQWAEVTENSSDAVAFEGTVHVEMPREVNGRVTLQPEIAAEDWMGIIDPSTMEFRGPGSESFALIVIAPEGALADAPANVVVTGYLKLPVIAPVVAAASVEVAVDYYFDVEITSREPVITVGRGETGDILLNLTNKGNSDLRVTVWIEGDHEGIDFEYPGEPYHVGSGESADIIARAKVGSDAPKGDARLTIFLQCNPSFSGASRSVTTFDATVNVPTFVQQMGPAGVVAIFIIVAAIGVGMYIGWRKGKLTKIQEIKKWLPKKKATD